MGPIGAVLVLAQLPKTVIPSPPSPACAESGLESKVRFGPSFHLRNSANGFNGASNSSIYYV